jgi:hypothetical protein
LVFIQTWYILINNSKKREKNMNKFYITLLILCCAIVAIFSIGASNLIGTDRSKEIKFSHKYHIKDGGLGCTDCHKDVDKSKAASDNLLPKMATCYTCHDEKTTECNKCHVDTTNYKPFDNPEREFRYSHQFHLSKDSMDCTLCHQGLEEVDYSFKAPKYLPNMDLCFGCHNNGMETSKKEEVKKINPKGMVASKKCESCHTDLSNLKPKNHLASDFRKMHARYSRAGKFDNDCAVCHTESFCQSCHNGTPLLPGKDLVSNATGDKSANAENFDGSKKMVLQNMHSLNYIMTHAFEAKSKSTECYTCHNQQTFCNECHSGASENAINRKPKWHTPTGFTTIGRGTGGGTHALYAKREIETCMICHDAQGGDPVCTMCHIDVDGVKGTDPKTHANNFMHEINGSWMTDDGAVCFNCHVDIGAKRKISGQGFCGYCHGKKR